jgi:hypothetical protein
VWLSVTEQVAATQAAAERVPDQGHAMKVSEHKPPSLTPQDVRDIAGDLDDAQIAAILATGANAEQLEEAMAWASGESDVMGDLEGPLAGVVARLYDILMTGEAFPEDRD